MTLSLHLHLRQVPARPLAIAGASHRSSLFSLNINVTFNSWSSPSLPHLPALPDYSIG